MNRWTAFNIISIFAGMVAAGMWFGIILSLVQAPSWSILVIGVLMGRVTLRLMRDQIR